MEEDIASTSLIELYPRPSAMSAYKKLFTVVMGGIPPILEASF